MQNENAPKPVSRVWGRSTRWTMIRKASGSEAGADVEQAWLDLVERYREPVTRSLRRRLRRAPVEDATNDFFAYLYDKQVLLRADPNLGRFRCYIQETLRRFALHYARPGARDEVELTEAPELGVEELTDLEVTDEMEWAEHVLRRARERLRENDSDDDRLLAATYGLDGTDPRPAKDVGVDVGKSAGAVHVALTRARRRLRKLIEDEVGETVSSPSDFDRERELMIRRLMDARPGLMSL